MYQKVLILPVLSGEFLIVCAQSSENVQIHTMLNILIIIELYIITSSVNCDLRYYASMCINTYGWPIWMELSVHESDVSKHL